MNESSPSIIEQYEQLVPLCNAAIKKDLAMLVDELRRYRLNSFSELKKNFDAVSKELKKSPGGFATRIQSYLDARKFNYVAQEKVDELVRDFKTLSAATIKTVAKKFDVNLSSKADAEHFAKWLQTGNKPPTAEELIAEEIDEYALKAIKLRDQDRTILSPEAKQAILDIADEIRKKHKVPGLRLFMRALDLEPTGTTAPSIIKALNGYLEALKIDRFKRNVIETM